jgi:hypothetical protein
MYTKKEMSFHWSLQYQGLEFLVENSHVGAGGRWWNLGLRFWTSVQAATDRMMPYDITREEEIQECTVSMKIHG